MLPILLSLSSVSVVLLLTLSLISSSKSILQVRAAGGNGGERLPAWARRCWKTSKHNWDAASAGSLHEFRRKLENFTKRNAFRVANHEKPTSNSANSRGTNQWENQSGEPPPSSPCSPPKHPHLPPLAGSTLAPTPHCFSCTLKKNYTRELLMSQSCSQ